VANYLVRMWVTTHLGTTTVERLPVPRPPSASRAGCRLLELGLDLLRAGGGHPAAYAEVQALASWSYGLSAEEFALVLESLPLVEKSARDAAAESYRRLAAKSGRW
jgi:hypothetical protein